MELIAGYVGTEDDIQANRLVPKIGWLVRVAESEEEQLIKLKSENNDLGIHLRVRDVPTMLRQLKHIKRLWLMFTAKVVLPEWFYNLKIDDLTIESDMSEEQEVAIRKHFPKASIRRPLRTQSDSDEPLIITIVSSSRVSYRISSILSLSDVGCQRF